MAVSTTVVAVAGLAVAAGGAIASYTQSQSAQRSQKRAEERAERAQQEQQASNAAQAAAEQRQQIRDERIKRGMVMNAAATTGASGSSGEFGALSSLSTQQGANIGFNQAGFLRGQRIGALNQSAANEMGNARSASNRASMFNQVSSMGTGMFNSMGGWSNPGFAKLFK